MMGGGPGDAREAFSAACAYVMPFGKHNGTPIARIGSNDEGLKYLDWLIGQEWVVGGLRDALATYLGHPAVSRRLEDSIDTE